MKRYFQSNRVTRLLYYLVGGVTISKLLLAGNGSDIVTLLYELFGTRRPSNELHIVTLLWVVMTYVGRIVTRDIGYCVASTNEVEFDSH